ncbi:50S ribosomal protein L32 [Lutibacter sp. B2]|nr:50S ribosomal protein L32 [Lutibacter sp. B2]
MAVPKRKTSKSRRDKRRASNIKMTAVNVVECPQCHEPKLQHRVCKECGFYKDKEVISVQ